jgi:hypothetical protein
MSDKSKIEWLNGTWNPFRAAPKSAQVDGKALPARQNSKSCNLPRVCTWGRSVHQLQLLPTALFRRIKVALSHGIQKSPKQLKDRIPSCLRALSVGFGLDGARHGVSTQRRNPVSGCWTEEDRPK